MSPAGPQGSEGCQRTNHAREGRRSYFSGGLDALGPAAHMPLALHHVRAGSCVQTGSKDRSWVGAQQRGAVRRHSGAVPVTAPGGGSALQGGQAEPAVPRDPSPKEMALVSPLCPLARAQHFVPISGSSLPSSPGHRLKQELTSTLLYCFLNKLPLPWRNIVL